MASSVWRGSIVLSLVNIPVKLFAAARAERTHLHQIHNVCHSRLKQPLFCPVCNRQVDRSEVIKGYEFDEGQYVLMAGDELKKLAAASSRNMDIVAFTKMSEIDPIFFDASYFCLPEDSGKKAYFLLLKAMQDTRTVGIGKLTMHQRDYTVFLRPYQHGILVHTMYFANEIRSLPEYGVLEPQTFKPAEVKLTEQLVESLTEPFKPKQYHNEFQERLKALIESKSDGRVLDVGEAPKKKAPVIDMMTALKKSLEAAGKGGTKALKAQAEEDFGAGKAATAKRAASAKGRKTLPARKAG